MTGVLIREQQREIWDIETKRWRKYEEGGRDEGDACTSQECQGLLAATYQKLGGHRTDSPSEPMEGTNLAAPWFQTSGLQNCEQINFWLFKPLSLW